MFKYIISLIKPGQYYLYTDVIDRLIAFIVFLIFAKSLSTSVYGQMVTLFAVTTIVSIVFDFGLPIYIQKESAKTNDLYNIYRETGVLKFFLSIVYALISFLVIILFIPETDLYLALLIIAATFLLGIGNTTRYFFYGRDNSREVFLTIIISKLIQVSIIAAAYMIYPNPYVYMSAYLFGHLFFTARLLTRLRAYNVKIIPNFPGFGEIKKILLLVLPLGFAMIFNILYDRIDVILLSFFLDYDKVAQYNVAYTVFKLSAISLSIFIFPAMNQFSREDNDLSLLSASLRKLGIIIFTCSVILMLLFYFLIPGLIILLFGNKYAEAGSLTGILSFSIIFLGLNSLAGVFLNAAGKFKAVMTATLAGVFINILLNIFMIPRYGTTGAVLVTIATELSILTIEAFFIYKFFKIKKRYT